MQIPLQLKVSGPGTIHYISHGINFGIVVSQGIKEYRISGKNSSNNFTWICLATAASDVTNTKQ